MMDPTRNRLLAAEALGFYPQALKYDRVYFWCLGDEFLKSALRLIIAALRDAVSDLSDCIDAGSCNRLNTILSDILEQWSTSYGSAGHFRLLHGYRGWAPPGTLVPPLAAPTDDDSRSPLEDVSSAGVAALKLQKSAPAGGLVLELCLRAPRCRRHMPLREQYAFDLGVAYGREWNERRYTSPAPLTDWVYEEEFGVERPATGSPAEPAMDLEDAAKG